VPILFARYQTGISKKETRLLCTHRAATFFGHKHLSSVAGILFSKKSISLLYTHGADYSFFHTQPSVVAGILFWKNQSYYYTHTELPILFCIHTYQWWLAWLFSENKIRLLYIRSCPFFFWNAPISGGWHFLQSLWARLCSHSSASSSTVSSPPPPLLLLSSPPPRLSATASLPIISHINKSRIFYMNESWTLHISKSRTQQINEWLLLLLLPFKSCHISMNHELYISTSHELYISLSRELGKLIRASVPGPLVFPPTMSYMMNESRTLHINESQISTSHELNISMSATTSHASLPIMSRINDSRTLHISESRTLLVNESRILHIMSHDNGTPMKPVSLLAGESKRLKRIKTIKKN